MSSVELRPSDSSPVCVITADDPLSHCDHSGGISITEDGIIIQTSYGDIIIGVQHISGADGVFIKGSGLMTFESHLAVVKHWDNVAHGIVEELLEPGADAVLNTSLGVLIAHHLPTGPKEQDVFYEDRF